MTTHTNQPRQAHQHTAQQAERPLPTAHEARVYLTQVLGRATAFLMECEARDAAAQREQEVLAAQSDTATTKDTATHVDDHSRAPRSAEQHATDTVKRSRKGSGA